MIIYAYCKHISQHCQYFRLKLHINNMVPHMLQILPRSLKKFLQKHLTMIFYVIIIKGNLVFWVIDMHLTSRQEEFLGALIDIYDELERSVHYKDVAAKLGVSKWTAYDMMAVLEKRGAIKKEYAVGKRASEGGRSQVMFTPTDQGRAMLADAREEHIEDEEWEKAKTDILVKIEKISETEYHTVAEQILKMVDSCASSITYWAANMTALLLTVEDMKRRLHEIPLLQGIMQRVHSTKSRLLALAEIGASLPQGDMGAELHEKLEVFISRNDIIIEQMGAAKQQKLLGFLGAVIERLARIA